MSLTAADGCMRMQLGFLNFPLSRSLLFFSSLPSSQREQKECGDRVFNIPLITSCNFSHLFHLTLIGLDTSFFFFNARHPALLHPALIFHKCGGTAGRTVGTCGALSASRSRTRLAKIQSERAAFLRFIRPIDGDCLRSACVRASARSDMCDRSLPAAEVASHSAFLLAHYIIRAARWRRARGKHRRSRPPEDMYVPT